MDLYVKNESLSLLYLFGSGNCAVRGLLHLGRGLL